MSRRQRCAGVIALLALSSASAGRCAPEPQYRPLAETTGQQYGLPAWMLSALVQAESEFCSRAVSATGALGLGQLMPSTARELGVKDAFDPAQNLGGAARYLRAQYLTFGSWPLALAAYNAGPGAVLKYKGVPPYAETQQYVQKVLGLYAAYSGQGAAVTATRPPGVRKLNLPLPEVTGGVPVPTAVRPGAAASAAPQTAATAPAAPAQAEEASSPVLGPPQWLTRTAPAPQATAAAAPPSTVPAAPQTTTLRRTGTQPETPPEQPVLTTVLRRGTP